MPSLTLLLDTPTKVKLSEQKTGTGAGGVLDRISDMASDVTNALGITEDDGLLTFDVSIEESHELMAEVTDYPVETGGVISDHIRKLPVKLSIEGEITDTPLVAIPFVSAVGGIVDTVTSLMGEPSKSVQAFETFEKLFDDGTIFDITTGLKLYKNMVITRLSVPRNNKYAKTLRFNADFREFRFVESDSFFVPGSTPPAAQIPLDANGTNNVSGGSNPADSTTNQSATDAASSGSGGLETIGRKLFGSIV